MRIRRSVAVIAATALCLGAAAAGAVAHASQSAASVTMAETCVTTGPVVESGTTLISHPISAQLTSASLSLPVPASVVPTASINSGGTVETHAALQLDLSATAADLLANRVKPGVIAAGYPQFADSAWVQLGLEHAAVHFGLTGGLAPVATPTATAGVVPATGSWSSNQATATLGHVGVDTRLPGAPLQVAMAWLAQDNGDPTPRTLTVPAATVTFHSTFSVGIHFYGSSLLGTVDVDWSCTPTDPNQVLATTAVTTGLPATAPLSLVTPPTVTEPPTTAPPTTTPFPQVPPTPPGACPAPALDSYGGSTTVQLPATGYFRVDHVKGRSWLVDPLGHPFWSAGINNVTYAGTPDRNGVAAYHDAVVAKYGSDKAWQDAQIARMKEWGYNTLGSWSEDFGGAAPYTLLLGLTGSDFSTGEMQDVWSTTWTNGARASIAAAGAAHRNDPMLVGYWFDNELHWGPDWRPLHLFEEYLNRPAAAEGKQAMIAWLQQRYGTFAAFAADFQTSATDWTTLAQPSTVTSYTPRGGAATRSAWMGAVAERYYSVLSDALKAADPNHLNLGARMIAQTTGVPVLQAAARHVDVLSLNTYPIDPTLVAPLLTADPTYLSVDNALAAQEAVAGKPILISEWGYRAADSGLPNTWPPLFPTLGTQGQRASAMEQYEWRLLATNWIVGQHFFEHSDEPAAGRFDGEDSNFGLVDKNDVPYAPVVQVSQTMFACAYQRLAAAPVTVPSSTTTTTAPAGSGNQPQSVPAVPVATEPRFTG